MFFTFEGVDGSGKSTQTMRVGEWLGNLLGEDRVVLTREPGGWEGAAETRAFVLSGGLADRWSEFFFFMMDRCEHVERVIRPSLAGGKIVLSDRYQASTLAYQIFSDPSLSEETVLYLSRLSAVVGLPQPTATFLLDLDVDAARTRLATRGENNAFDERGRAYQARVREGYLRLMACAPPDACWIRIDAAHDPDDVFLEIREHLAVRMEL